MELDDSPETQDEPVAETPPGKAPKKRGLCPNCGSTAVRASRPGTNGALIRSFGAKDEYRCLECNASFGRISLRRLIGVPLVLATILAALTYIAMATLLPPKASTALPGVGKDKVPRPSPPVFR